MLHFRTQEHYFLQLSFPPPLPSPQPQYQPLSQLPHKQYRELDGA